MSFLSEEEKRSVILAGTNLFIEGVREREEPAGKNIPLTSSFFAVQTAIKVAFQSGQFKLSNVNTLGRIYGINRYARPSYTPYFGKKLMNIAKAREIDFDVKGDKIISNVPKSGARSLFIEFLEREYEYSVSKNLKDKRFDAHTEVIVWHLLDDIYHFPRPVGYENKLIYDIVKAYSKIEVDGKRVWDPDKLTNVPLMVDAWMKRLIETAKFDVVPIQEVGPMYSPPRFSDIEKDVLFKGAGSDICRQIFELALRSPAWPIRATRENNLACKHLTSAGLIEYVSENAPGIRDFGYVIPRDLFIDVDAKLGCIYSDKGCRQESDIALTEQLFRTVGRGRLAAHVLKSTDFSVVDGKLKELEGGGASYDKALEFILNPLEIKGCIEKNEEEGKFVVVPGMMNDIKILLDVWDNFEFIKLQIPEEEFAREKRAAQTRVQARNKAMSLFA